MTEPAALITLSSADQAPAYGLPPATDLFPDDVLDVLEPKVARAELALRDKRYDDVVAVLRS